MPYLNDVKIVANLAIDPELSLTKSGREYCNFTVRLVYKNDLDETLEDFIRITSYDYIAEAMVRDCKKGDLIIVTGYLAQIKWTAQNPKDTATNSRMVVIANSVERLARANGEMPPVPKDYLSMRDYNPVAFNDGEEIHISSYTMLKQMRIGGDHTPLSSTIYPQPKKDGTWKMPKVGTNERTRKWLQRQEERNRPVLDSESKEAVTIQENNPCRRQKADGGGAVRTPAGDGGAVVKCRRLPRDESGRIIIPKHVMRIAERFIPFGMNTTRGWVTLPDKKVIKYDNYANIARMQEKVIAEMSIEERRQLAIAVMDMHNGSDYGIIEKSKHLDADIVMLRKYCNVVRMRNETEAENGMNVAEHNGNGEDLSKSAPVPAKQLPSPAADGPDRLPVSGGKPNDWWQDSSGEWHRRTTTPQQ